MSGYEPASRLRVSHAGHGVGLSGEIASARRACTGILFWPRFRCSPGTRAGLSVLQAGAAGHLQEKSSKAPSFDLIATERSRRFQRLVQGNINLKKCKKKLEKYSTKTKLITKQKDSLNSRNT
jgi:hypothetical protein